MNERSPKAARQQWRRVPLAEIRRVVNQIVERFDPERVILFGSYASGRPRPGSDVDLLVVMDTPKPTLEQAGEIHCEVDHRFGLDLIVRTPQQLAERIALGDFFLREIAQQGKVVYERPGA